MNPRPAPHAAVVVPLRAFRGAKARLAGSLDDDARAALARDMAERVLAAAPPLPSAVVTSDPEVQAWATSLGAAVLPDPGTLDGAAAAGRAWAAALGAVRVVVAHADLPLVGPGGLPDLAADGAQPIATIVPDHRDDGTPVLSVPVAAPFVFAYGPGSFRLHTRAARAARLAVRVCRDPHAGFDVDVESDLERLRSHFAAPSAPQAHA